MMNFDWLIIVWIVVGAFGFFLLLIIKKKKPAPGVAQFNTQPTRKEVKQKQAENKSVLESVRFSDDILKLGKKYQTFSNQYVNELQAQLIQADISTKLVLEITNELSKKVKEKTDITKANSVLGDVLRSKYYRPSSDDLNFQENKLNVALIIGVNGTGKTTSIAKLAYKYKAQGAKILLIAADTFRAGATEQLKYWATKVGVDIVTAAKPNQDPASLVFDGMKKATSEGYDLAIIDTAGRLQNKVNLMKELMKINKTIAKFSPKAPDETLLVLDATTGKNGLQQAKVFHECVKLTGIIITKMDGSAKGGNVISVNNELRLPIRFLGVGERVEDLIEFDLDDYLAQLITN